jgi:hypothetical protein
MKIQIGNHWRKGLGTQLCALSAFVHAGVKEIEVNDMAIYNALTENKQILNLDITITMIANEGLIDPLNPDDCFKLFSPYYKKPRSNGRRKPYIGLACYDSAEHVFDSTNQDLSYPFNKLYPLENNADIFKIIKRAGYDVVTIDSKDATRAEKAWIVENLCECVIGYEGGIAHLSHMLNVPYIMLPWRHNGGLEQLLHLDNSTYFLNSVHELLNWINNDKHKLNDTINALNQGRGNNKFLRGERGVVIDENIGLKDNEGNLIPIWFNNTEKEFFKNHIGTLKLGGQ